MPRSSRAARASSASASTWAISTFQDNARLVHDAGARTTNLTLAWDQVEHDDPDAGDASPPTYLFAAKLHVANLVLPDEGIGATVTVDALDFGGLARPPISPCGRSTTSTSRAATAA